MAAIHWVGLKRKIAGWYRGRCDWIGLAKSAVQSAGDAREEACRQTLMVLQHDELVREASEFRSHGVVFISFAKLVQQ
ncbi:hypothetical protein ABID21_002781 [Pseudorhizobium tarimense]|uniref:Uncharacterized protein n=1 Tax=Pseudorhizobium tarimense TaxID=1079109 RepID=A0ABV2H7Y2_9HYPH|nr:hypothetical protein [Pseudorhizobium tarimense]MCJ8519932.1 hypothetical protein [Pseudorhizobium tarimense]